MKRRKKCAYCHTLFDPHPRTYREQKACPKNLCRKARHREAQRRWRLKNPAHDDDREKYYRQWRQKNPGYWRTYRKKNPAYAKRNRELQTHRNHKKRRLIAKRDALEWLHLYKLRRIEVLGVIAKRDPDRIPVTRQTEEIRRYLKWIWRIANQDPMVRGKTISHNRGHEKSAS